MVRRIFGIALLVLVAVSSAEAQTIDRRVGVAQVASTHIRILGAFYMNSGSTEYECVAFANDGKVDVTDAMFRLFYSRPSKNTANDQEIDVRATVKAGDRLSLPTAGADPSQLPNCVPFIGDRSSVAMTMIMPGRYQYADGTSWELKAKASPTPSPSPTPQPQSR